MEHRTLPSVGWAQRYIGMYGLSSDRLSAWHTGIQNANGILTWDVTSTTGISILPPGAANAVVLLVDLQVDVPQPLRDPDAKIDA